MTTADDATSAPAERADDVPGRATAFGVMVFGTVAVLAFWIVWFFVDRKLLATLDTPEYYAFENAFPLADGWMGVCSAVGAWALWTRRPSSLFWMLTGGSASLYLGFMDVLFDLEHGVYRAPNGDWGAVITELCVNAATVGFGAWILRFAWKNRERLLRQRPRV